MKSSLSADDVMIYVENLMESTKRATRIKEVTIIVECKIKIQKSVVFLNTSNEQS